MSDSDSKQSLSSRSSPHSSYSPIIPSWWSDSDGRRSMHDGKHSGNESPWWESDAETAKQLVHHVTTPDVSPVSAICDDITSSSVTPPWWAEPSSHEVSSSETEVEVNRSAAEQQLHQDNEKRNKGSNEDEKEKGMSQSDLNCRKRLREQSHISANTSCEPPASKIKLERPSPPVVPNSVHDDLRRGICHPLQTFLLFFTVDNLSRMCDLTNANGWQMVLENPSLADEDGSWKEVTVKELYVFIAVILIMQQNQDILFGAFWCEDRGRNTNWPRTLMKRSRFFTLLQMLTYIENDTLKSTRDSCVKPSSQQATNSKFQLENQSSPRNQFRSFFDQLQSAFEVFFHQYVIHSAEEIQWTEGGPQSFRNYMKILSQPRQGYEELRMNTWTKEQCRLEGNLTETTTEPACHDGESEMQECSEMNRARDKLSKEECTTETKSVRVHLSSSEKCNNLPKPRTNFIHVKWENKQLSVTHSKHSSQMKLILPLSYSDKEQNHAVFVDNDWQEVFIPCPELVYKEFDAGRTEDDAVHKLDVTGGRFERSYFYHYLHLAVSFSLSEDLKSRHVGSINRCLDHADALNKIVDGLVQLAENEPVLQSDSESEASEPDASHDSSTSSEDKADSADAEVKLRLHKYIQARSQVSRKCAVCWLLHQEVRCVHTRCIRCKRHFCVSRFRNCMQEAHSDEEVMKQLWEEDTSDKESSTSDKQGNSKKQGTCDKSGNHW